MKYMNFYFNSTRYWSRSERSFDTITVSVDVEEMFKWNEVDLGECVAQHCTALVSETKNIWNKFFTEEKQLTSDLVKSTIDRFIAILENRMIEEYEVKVSDVYDDDESGEYFGITVEYSNEELIHKRLTDAVYEFLGTKEEMEITVDLVRTQLAVYKLSV